MRIDLHAHSTASDGTDTPAELTAAARAAGLDVLALTDHDTTAGWVARVAGGSGVYRPSGARYYVAKAELDVLAAAQLVRRCGGVPVFAHPLARRRGRVVGDDAVAAMAAAGLAGLEVDHPDQDPADRAHLHRLAAYYGLLATGSSDYHGA